MYHLIIDGAEGWRNGFEVLESSTSKEDLEALSIDHPGSWVVDEAQACHLGIFVG